MDAFKQGRDALLNTMDVLSSEIAAHNFPELSLSPLFEQKWASLYEACEDGKIDADRSHINAKSLSRPTVHELATSYNLTTLHIPHM